MYVGMNKYICLCIHCQPSLEKAVKKGFFIKK